MGGFVIGGVPTQRWDGLASAAAKAGRDPRAGLDVLASTLEPVPLPGRGDTAARWAALATLGAVDLSVARALEPHLDALAILDEADRMDLAAPDSTWGVYAAEGAGRRLVAEQFDGGWRLTGVKPWCSLAREVSHALVTAWTSESERGLFAVGMQGAGVAPLDEPWVPHGLRNIRSTAVEFADAPAVPVGAPRWYLERDGFAWGGIGVAAVWCGGAVGVLRRMVARAQDRPLDQLGESYIGRVDAALAAAEALLAASAQAIDSGEAAGETGAIWALRVRQVVADAVELTLQCADHALGPGPLTNDADHADRVADLRLYVRQHHAERDAAALGRALVGQEAS